MSDVQNIELVLSVPIDLHTHLLNEIEMIKSLHRKLSVDSVSLDISLDEHVINLLLAHPKLFLKHR